MHIKIQGFKSYRDETVVDPFSPGLNLLVGRNGSGKSNFFSAIRFVLSDAYTSLSREERQALLHDGSAASGGGEGGAGAGGGGGLGGATMSAFVEIEFDNSDGRFPTNKPTMVLRRTIGLKKDEYQMDRKSTSKGEVMSMLESAGFSRSNPYYIVPQGRINHLTNQKDLDRLLLLKEVAGTKVYEERRAESTKIMDETNVKREKIKDLLNFIQERLDELEEEKEELKQYQTHDRARRSLEYCIYQRELKDCSEALDAIEEERRRDIDQSNTRREEYNQREKELTEMNDRLKAIGEKLEELKVERREGALERREKVKQRSRAELGVREMEETGKKGQDRLAALEKELEKIETDIITAEASLMESTPAYEDAVTRQSQLSQSLETSQTTLNALFAKQGRTSQFSTRAERDEHLTDLIRRNEETLEKRRRREQALREEVEMGKKELGQTGERRREVRGDMERRKEGVMEARDQSREFEQERNEKIEQRKELWRSDTKLSVQANNASETLKTAERTISSTMDRDTANGLRAARNIAQQLCLEGYYGPLYELFEVEDRYKTAVEVTAGTSLFQIVVDNDETATKILERMIQDKSGRVTFMPLNRLDVKEYEYPQTNEAIPMINKLRFNPMFLPAFKQVFGSTIICQTLEIAGAYTRSHNLNAITLDGDKYDRKGSLTGGFHDVRRSRLDAVKNLKAAQAKDEELSTNRNEVKQTIARIDQEITGIVGKITVVNAKLERLSQEGGALQVELMRIQEEEDRLKGRVARLEKQLVEHETNMKGLEKEVEMMKAELETEMVGGLSEDEKRTMKQLSEECEQTKKDLVQITQQVNELASRKDVLEIELNENLRRRRDDLRSKIEQAEAARGGVAEEDEDDSGEDLEQKRRDLKKLDQSITEIGQRLEEIDKESEKLSKEAADLEKEREKRETQQSDDQRNIARQQKNVERYLAKRQILTQRKDECNKNIRDLGVLPEEAFVETTASSEKLLKKLRKVNEALKGFAHVNKKAYEQYTSFTKQRDELIARQEELDESQNSILELIDVLDARKDEAIERTFKQVAKNFEEVFEKLVPTGRGRLIMLKRQQARDEDDMDVDEPEPEDGGVENYTGVSIRVSFKSKSNEGLKLQQLSGGQKALVALAMIFAIQKCDPAPFYLFDEIDAQLDADRRTAVAAMIDELSQEAQYICTTFRAELIPHARSYFGVVFNQAKISSVKRLTADECSTFIEAAEQVRA
ncbi:cohesin subunit SMC3 [Sporobolomyces salmoneus]|uniref:cohesin subunit SMC3 n=1 Tax=Sporobolomyces salmoneus TaxID=183962 RepID=UPI003172E0DD